MLASTKSAIPVNDLTPGQGYTFQVRVFGKLASPIGAPQPNGCSNGTIISGSSVIGDSCETSIFAAEIDFSETDTIIDASLTSFFAAEIIISAAKKTAGALRVCS